MCCLSQSRFCFSPNYYGTNTHDRIEQDKLQLLLNEERNEEERQLHLKGNINANGVNVHYARQIIIDHPNHANGNQTDERQTSRSLCGVGWDIRHIVLVILVISTIIVMIVVLSKCPQVRISVNEISTLISKFV